VRRAGAAGRGGGIEQGCHGWRSRDSRVICD
jgi:hypothetical protein